MEQLTVYPRWRGEHEISTVDISVIGGLSPAGAGNTILTCFTLLPSAVYPRWRGEHPTVIAKSCCLIGLSPLARGTRDQHRQPKTTVRFIPAGAGNTVSEYAG
ncbi:hypothetical protein SEENP079_06849 [Salmonella enterica subsp. enterica serovar Newport str. RI_10P079]|nr:hypothetical protein SEENP079_06849 [Salmonella enterica subsp. enterica serovar Newport str. RI_10P079]